TSEAVGPAAVPLPVGVLLGVVGAGLLVQARARFGSAPRETTWQPKALLRVLGMVAALVAFAALLPVLGYVVSATALFVAAAVLLGAPGFWRTVAYGWALAAIVFLVFDRLIGLSLPTGPWGFGHGLVAPTGEGFGAAITPGHLLWALIGVTLGTAVGVLPGIGPALTVALLLPVTYKLDPASSTTPFLRIIH